MQLRRYWSLAARALRFTATGYQLVKVTAESMKA